MGNSKSTLDYRTKASNVRRNPCLQAAKEKLYADRNKTGDVKFSVGSEVIPAHRCVLAALSPKYETEFYGSLPESGLVKIKDVSSAAFNEFLQFFYAVDVTLTIENIEDVFHLAKQSLNEKIVNECTDFLLEIIALDKICWCYHLALLHDLKLLREFCEDHIGCNIKVIFETEDFLSCKRDVLHEILKLDTLNCTEMDVFNACIAWAQESCKRKKVDRKGFAPNVFCLRTALGDEIVEQIRFCVMSIEQFAAIDKKYSGFLSVQESNEIYRVIGKATNGKSSRFTTTPRVPKTISTIRSKDDVASSKTIQCSFIDKVKSSSGNPSESDSIAFLCDKTILLNGFMVCNKFADQFIIDIETGTRYLKDYKHTAWPTTSITREFTKVMFAEPIQVNRNERCLITAKSKHFKELELMRYSLVAEKMERGAWFQILKSHLSDFGPKMITHLLFNLTDEPER